MAARLPSTTVLLAFARKVLCIYLAVVLTAGLLVLYIRHTATINDWITASFPTLHSLTSADPLRPETYSYSTSPVFPPVNTTPGHSIDLCRNFPQQWLETVQVVMKTGVAESEHNRAQLASVGSCLKNMIVVSDFEEQVAGYDFIDILKTLPTSYTKHPDFSTYYTQQSAHSNGSVVEPSTGGWKLDRFKFLPMVETAYEMRPNASWYVFFEADVYIFWDNLFRLLGQYDAQEMHYFGSAVPGSYGRWFAYGGAGIVLSQGLMSKLIDNGPRLSERYRKMVTDDCCGDAVLAYVIYHKLGVKLENLHPMLSGDYLEDLKINEQRWCTPIVSLHRVSATALRSLWSWERTRHAPEV